MKIYGVSNLIDYEYLRFMLKDEPIHLAKKLKQTDTFVRNVKGKVLKAINSENRKSFLRSITSRR